MTLNTVGSFNSDAEIAPRASPNGSATVRRHAVGTAEKSAASKLEEMLSAILTGLPQVRFELWDGSSFGPESDVHAIRINSPDALRHIMWAPGELGIARAFVHGHIDTNAPVAEVLRSLQRSMPDRIGIGIAALPVTVSAARSLGAFGKRPPPPPEEMVARGVPHSIRRDRETISHHYDVGNAFYSIVLGSAMTYSCARFVGPDTSLEDAQAAKHELICQKLGLAEPEYRAASIGDRPRLLDVGCGWGSMAIHSAQYHDVDVVGITISEEQAALARDRVAECGLEDRVEIRLQDYRETNDGPYDAISSIGMSEHVGKKRMPGYFDQLNGLLRPGGRLLNHAIASIEGSKMSNRSFVGRYVFPDGELLALGDTITAMHGAGFEVRDVENLREHYSLTLAAWIANLEAGWDEAVRLVGVRRARVWQLYMSGSQNGFDDGGLQLNQTLGVKNANGVSHMPRARSAWS